MILRLPLRLLGRIWNARAWRPDRARLLWSQVAHRGRNRDAGFTEDDHLRAAAEWLAVAQDAMTDGGVGGRYRLDGGWTSSYPETTGYIIPTFLALSRHFGDPTFKLRAKRCAETRQHRPRLAPSKFLVQFADHHRTIISFVSGLAARSGKRSVLDGLSYTLTRATLFVVAQAVPSAFRIRARGVAAFRAR